MKAFLKNYRQSPRKVRLIANLIRGKKVSRAITLLSTADKRASGSVRKLIESAVANAKNVSGSEKENLIVKNIQVNEGFVFKRYRPRARGRSASIRKKTSNISIILEKLKDSDSESKKSKVKAKSK